MRKPSPYLEQRRSFTSADIEWDVCGELPANLWDSIRWITLIPRLTDSSKISFGRTLSLRWKSRGLFPVYRIYWSVNRAHYHCTGFINVSGRELGFLHVQFTGPLLEPFSKVGMCLLLSLGTEVGFSTTLHTVFYNLSGFTFEFTSELSDKCSWSPMICYTWFSWGFSPLLYSAFSSEFHCRPCLWLSLFLAPKNDPIARNMLVSSHVFLLKKQQCNHPEITLRSSLRT